MKLSGLPCASLGLLLCGCTPSIRMAPNEAAAAAEAREWDAAEARRQKGRKASLEAAKKAEGAALAAEKAGRAQEAFERYLEGVKALTEDAPEDLDFRLRGRLVKLAAGGGAAPEISENVQRQMAFGKAALKEAKSPEDEARAADEFAKAVELAPWWATAYYNLALIEQKLGRADSAAEHLKLYLASSPDEGEAKKIKEKIFELEYAQKRRAESLAGSWKLQADPAEALPVGSIADYKLAVGERNEAARLEASYMKENRHPLTIYYLYSISLDQRDFTGKLDVYQSLFCNPTVCKNIAEGYTIPVQGRFSKDWTALVLRYDMPVIDARLFMGGRKCVNTGRTYPAVARFVHVGP